MSEYNPKLNFFVVADNWIDDYKEDYRTPDYEVFEEGVVIFENVKSEVTDETKVYWWRWLQDGQLVDVKLYPGDERPIINYLPLPTNVEEVDAKVYVLEKQIKLLVN